MTDTAGMTAKADANNQGIDRLMAFLLLVVLSHARGAGLRPWCAGLG